MENDGVCNIFRTYVGNCRIKRFYILRKLYYIIPLNFLQMSSFAFLCMVTKGVMKNEINRYCKKGRRAWKNCASHRRTLDIAEKDALEIYVDGNMIVLKKYEPCCVFCGDAKDIMVFKGKNVCHNCAQEMQKF